MCLNKNKLFKYIESIDTVQMLLKNYHFKHPFKRVEEYDNVCPLSLRKRVFVPNGLFQR